MEISAKNRIYPPFGSIGMSKPQSVVRPKINVSQMLTEMSTLEAAVANGSHCEYTAETCRLLQKWSKQLFEIQETIAIMQRL